MARGNYPNCKKITLVWEGGTVDHPDDPGGFTHAGVTAAAGANYRRRMGLPPKRVDLWTAAEIDAFYRDDYWNGVNGELLPWGVDLATFDFGVNSGPSRAARYLQSVASVGQDGRIGPVTLNAVASMNGKVVVQKLCGKRLSFVQGLSTFKVFGRGWSRRIADIEAKGVAMWLAAGGALSGQAVKELQGEAGTAGKVSGNQNKGAGSTVAVGGGGTGTEVLAGDANGWIIAAIVAVTAIVAIGLFIKSRQNKARADAYERVAEGAAPDLFIQQA